MLQITNLTKTPVNDRFLEGVATATLERIKRTGHINLILVNDNRMRELNKQYRGKDKTTDVLAFPNDPIAAAGEDKDAAPFIIPEKEHASDFLGEVVISLHVAEKQALAQGHSFARELATLFVHGILHICGYDHERSEEDHKLMMGLQAEVISKINMQKSLTRSGVHP